MTPLDLDEIARRKPTWADYDRVFLTAAELDALVAAALRLEALLRGEDASGPEMPKRVAGLCRRLRGLGSDAIWEDCREAATLIEALERGRREAEARHAKTEKDACMWAERAEQSAKELAAAASWRANVEVKLRVTRQALNDAESRLAKLEAVVWKARLYAKYPIPGRLRELNAALAALDRKG